MDSPDVDPCTLYLGTGNGLVVARLAGETLAVIHRGIEGNAVRDVAVHPDDPADAFVGCGLRGWGLYHTKDAGKTVESLGFEDQWVWGVTRDPTDPDRVYVGTEPPTLSVSDDGGETFEAFAGIDELPSRDRWTFFHEPFEAGHVHGIAIHPDRPERIVAGVEHGALVRSVDGGETWDERLVGHDLHRIAFHPDDPDVVAAAAGDGLHTSRDGGNSWESVDPLHGKYLHAIVFDPSAPERMYVYADRKGAPVYASEDGGERWELVGEGLPAAKPADTLRLHPTDPETLLYVGDVDEGESRLFASPDRGQSWTPVGETFEKTWRLEVAPPIDSPELELPADRTKQ